MTAAFFAVAIPAVILLGLAKGGFAGLGGLALPLMALVISPVEAAGILLPILLVQDVVGVIAYRRSWDRWNLAVLLPGAAVGIAAGYLFAALVPVAAVSLWVGFISIAFGLYRLLERAAPAPSRRSVAFGLVCGVGSGLTSMMIHAGGPPFQIFVMPQNLPHRIFVGTSVIFFAMVNLLKVGPYLLLGQFRTANLTASLSLFPLAILSTLAGFWLVQRFQSALFYQVIYGLMILVGLKLVADGAMALIG